MLDKRYKNIKGFEEYMITEDGEVYSYKNKYKCRNGLKKLKIRYSKNGYGYVDCVDGERRKRFQIHRLVAEYFCDGYFEGAVINHIDGNTKNNHYTNLEWCTQKENIHKGYKTSGVSQVRNFRLYCLIYPDGKQSPILKGNIEVKQYIEENNLNISHSMIMKHKKHNGYTLEYRD